MEEEKKITLQLNFTLSKSPEETLERIGRVMQPKTPEVPDPRVDAIHFLRATAGRASHCLQPFYMFVGAAVSEPEDQDDKRKWPYSFRVAHTSLEFSSICTIALATRAIYAHPKKPFSARGVAALNNEVANSVAEYWVDKTKSNADEAAAAVRFLQSAFERFAISPNAALQTDCVLARRIALLKAYANRVGAHITRERYDYTLPDVGHVVAATCLLGAVIHHFDYPGLGGAAYLAALDEAAYSNAAGVFPELRKAPRLFDDKKSLEQMLRNLYMSKVVAGEDYLSIYLPSALGWENPRRELFEIFRLARDAAAQSPIQGAGNSQQQGDRDQQSGESLK